MPSNQPRRLLNVQRSSSATSPKSPNCGSVAMWSPCAALALSVTGQPYAPATTPIKVRTLSVRANGTPAAAIEMTRMPAHRGVGDPVP